MLPDREWEAYVAHRVEMMAAGKIPIVEAELSDGRSLLYQCIVLPDGGRMLTYFDITEQKLVEAELREKSAIVELLHKIAADSNQAEDVAAAIKGCLEAICDYTGWPIGHGYVRALKPGQVQK